MSSKIVKSLSVKFELLRSAIASGDIALITGLPSTGKTTVAKSVLDEHPDYMYVYINCNNIATTSMLYLEILRLLHNKLKPNHDSKKMSLKSTIVALDFQEKYMKLRCQALEEGFDRIFVILDQIELFRKTPMMEAVVLLTTGFKVDSIFISGENGNDLIDGINSANRSRLQDILTIIDLNVWNRDDLIESILEQLPSESVELYEKFVHNVVSTAYTTNTKDFVELRSFCQENFGNFIEFYKNKTCEMLGRDGTMAEDMNFDDVDFDSYEGALPSIATSIGTFLSSFKDSIQKGGVRDWGDTRVDRKVVLHTAALIIASYVAAYTRPSDDKRNFISYQKRMSKRTKTDNADYNPKNFTMERLIHIYRGVIILLYGLEEESQVLRQDSVLSDIQLLQDLDLISIVTGDGLDSQTRYKISHHISRDYVDALSKSIEFDLNSLTGIPLVSK